jgi:hypothetical protein
MELTPAQFDKAKDIRLCEHGYLFDDIVGVTISWQYLSRLIPNIVWDIEKIRPGFFRGLISVETFYGHVGFVPPEYLPDTFAVLEQLQDELVREENRLKDFKAVFKGKTKTQQELDESNKKEIMADKKKDEQWERRQWKDLKKFEQKLIRSSIKIVPGTVTNVERDRHCVFESR